MSDLMGTREAARYLGINEKKVYALAKGRAIPCTRVTGKWVFPKKLIDNWIEESAAPGRQSRPVRPGRFLLAAGSDDPSIAILRELYSGDRDAGFFFTAPAGSTAGLKALGEGTADVALSHLRDGDSGEYNLPFLRKLLRIEVVVVALFHRELGLLVGSGNPSGLRRIRDLRRRGVRIINRQSGSGTRHYLDMELARASISRQKIAGYGDTVATHLEVGLKVLRGEADAGLATQAIAQLLGLDFVPLSRERFDLVIPKERFFSPAIQTLLDIVGSRDFRARMAPFTGYDAAESGRIFAGQ